MPSPQTKETKTTKHVKPMTPAPGDSSLHVHSARLARAGGVVEGRAARAGSPGPIPGKDLQINERVQPRTLVSWAPKKQKQKQEAPQDQLPLRRLTRKTGNLQNRSTNKQEIPQEACQENWVPMVPQKPSKQTTTRYLKKGNTKNWAAQKPNKKRRGGRHLKAGTVKRTTGHL